MNVSSVWVLPHYTSAKSLHSLKMFSHSPIYNFFDTVLLPYVLLFYIKKEKKIKNYNIPSYDSYKTTIAVLTTHLFVVVVDDMSALVKECMLKHKKKR